MDTFKKIIRSKTNCLLNQNEKQKVVWRANIFLANF